MSDDELIEQPIQPFTEEQKQAIEDLAIAFFNIYVDLVSTFHEVFETLKGVAQAINDFVNEINSYPDKRVVYLCFHAKKERTRNKNINRVLKWSRRQKKIEEGNGWKNTSI